MKSPVVFYVHDNLPPNNFWFWKINHKMDGEGKANFMLVTKNS
jgi:hypothetical protein